MSAAVTDDVISKLQTLITPNAAKFDVVPEHWIHGWDEGLSFCRECAEKKVAELLAAEPDGDYLVAGGYGMEGDSQAFCETCERALDNSYTEYAVEVELDHFEEHGFDLNSPDDCHAVLECTYALGCGDDELNQRLEKLAEKIMATGRPKRIQRTRAKGSKLPDGALCVTRPGPLGNPFKVGMWFRKATADWTVWTCGDSPHFGNEQVRDLPHSLELFKDYAEHRAQWQPTWLDPVRAAQFIACWCRVDATCHGDTLIELAFQ